MSTLPSVLLMSLRLLLGAGEGPVETIPPESAQPEEVESLALCTQTYTCYYYSSPARTTLFGYASCACGREPSGWGGESSWVRVELGPSCDGGSTGAAPAMAP